MTEPKQEELISLLKELITSKNKKILAKLISDDNYFDTNDLIKALEKKAKPLLFRILNEPSREADLRQPIVNWLKKEDYYYDFEVDYPNSHRKIDVVGCKYSKYAGLVGEDKIIAIELKTSPSMSAIDSAFSQAKDYVDCSDWSYVAVSPYAFLKYSKVLLEKVKRLKNEVGLLLVDKLRVISEVAKAKHTGYEDQKYETIIEYFRQQTS